MSKIPGPKLAAFTRFILIYHRARGTSESWLSELHDKYGDVVRSAPNDISFATSRAWKDVYGYAPGSKLAKNAKDPTYYAEYGKGISMVTADDSTHVRQRKLFSHAFSDKAIREQESIIQQNITQLISNLSKTAEASTKTDIVQDYNFASFDIMGDLAWGEPLGCLRNSAYTPWVSMIFSSVKLLALFAEVRSIPIFRSKTTMRLIIKSLPKSVTEKAGKHMKQAEDRVDARIANGNSRPDIWGKVLAIDDEEERGQKLHIDEIHANAQLFMVAGTETIATLLSGLTYYLLQNPEVMKTLTKEIRGSFTSGSDITIASMSELTYLDACVNEALRIYPPVPAGLPRCVARGGATICGYNLPEMVTTASTLPLPSSLPLLLSFISNLSKYTTDVFLQIIRPQSPCTNTQHTTTRVTSTSPTNSTRNAGLKTPPRTQSLNSTMTTVQPSNPSPSAPEIVWV